MMMRSSLLTERAKDADQTSVEKAITTLRQAKDDKARQEALDVLEAAADAVL